MSVLAGCKIDGTIGFQSDSRTRIVLTFEDADGVMARIKQICKGVHLAFEAELTFTKNPKVEDITPSGSYLRCRLTSNEPFGGRVKSTKDGGKYYFKYPSAYDKDSDDCDDFITNITISMPAKVVKVSKGEVNGNRVTITSLDLLTHGMGITAEKESTRSLSSSGLPGKKVHTSSSTDEFPVWAWAVVGNVLVAIAGLALVAGEHRVR